MLRLVIKSIFTNESGVDALLKLLSTFSKKPEILRLFLTTENIWTSIDILESIITLRSLTKLPLPKNSLPIRYEVCRTNDPLENDRKLHLLSLTLRPFAEVQPKNSSISSWSIVESQGSCITKKQFICSLSNPHLDYQQRFELQ